jgi:hypothetical protein
LCGKRCGKSVGGGKEARSGVGIVGEVMGALEIRQRVRGGKCMGRGVKRLRIVKG